MLRAHSKIVTKTGSEPLRFAAALIEEAEKEVEVELVLLSIAREFLTVRSS